MEDIQFIANQLKLNLKKKLGHDTSSNWDGIRNISVVDNETIRLNLVNDETEKEKRIRRKIAECICNKYNWQVNIEVAYNNNYETKELYDQYMRKPNTVIRDRDTGYKEKDYIRR